MSEPKTAPQSFVVQVMAQPNAAHAVWLERTERLLAAFERSLPAQRLDPLAPGFVLLAADYLWDEQAERADFARLDVNRLIARCSPLLSAIDIVHSFGKALAGFYAFLKQHGEIDPGAATIIAAQLRRATAEFDPSN
jgi:hypothetical protein